MVLSDLINFATYYYKKATKSNAMRAAGKLKHILHDLLKKQCPKIHQKRLNSLMLATESQLNIAPIIFAWPLKRIRFTLGSK
jgi:hypothetical protein